MALSQHHATPPEEDIDSAPAFNLRKHPHEYVDEVSEELEVDSPRNSIATAQVRIPARLEQLVPMKKHVSKLLKGADFDRNMSLRVVAASLQMQEDYIRAKRKHGKGKTVAIPKPAVRANICRLFGISAPTYGKIMRAYLTNRQIYVSGKFDNGRSGNLAQRDTRVPQTKAVENQVREWVRQRRLQGKCWIFWLISGTLLFQEIIAQVGMKEMGYY